MSGNEKHSEKMKRLKMSKQKIFEKKTVKKEKIEKGQVDLKEILGDIKTVVSGEKETLFKVSEYKTINLKKENLVMAGEKRHSTGLINLKDKKMEGLIRKIVRSE